MFETLPSRKLFDYLTIFPSKNVFLIDERCSSKFVSVVALTLTILVILCFIPLSLNPAFSAIHVVYIQNNVRPKHMCNTKFLSVALDSSLLADGFSTFNFKWIY